MSQNQSVVLSGAESSSAHLHRGAVLTVLLLGAFVSILNQTLLNVAIPHLMNDFNVSAGTVQWLSTGYMLTNGVLIPLSAFLIGTFTTRQLFIAAMTSFTVGSFICSIAPGFEVMMFGRVVQALGAGVIMPLMMTVIINIYPPEVRGRAMGMIGIAMFFAPAVGPTLSGWIIENWSWRLLFYVAIPIAIADIVLAMFLLKNVTEKTNPKFDLWGFVTSTIGFGTLLYGCSEAGNKGWGDATVVLFLIMGILFIALFIVRELTAKSPMLNLRVFKYDMFSLATIVSCIVNMAMFGAALLVPIYIQNIRGYSPIQSGLLLLPGALLMGIMSPISGALMDRFGIRPLAIIGLAITAISTWQFANLTMDTAYGHVMLLYTFRMFGMSFIAMTIMTSGLNQLPRHLGSHGTAASNTARQVAASIGTAILITIMSTRTNLHLAQFGNTVSSANPNLSHVVQSLGQGLAFHLGQTAHAGTAIMAQLLYGLALQQSTVMGINDSFTVATVLTVIALIASFFLRRAVHGQMRQSKRKVVQEVGGVDGQESQKPPVLSE